MSRRAIEQSILHGIAAIAAIIALAPFLWMVSSAFKPASQILVFPPEWIPREFVWTNFSESLSRAPFGRFFINSGIQAVAATLGVLLVSSMAGYAFAKFRFHGRDILFLACLSTMMIPPIVTVIPNYLIIQTLGWLDTFQALVIPVCGSAFGIYLMRQFILTIPDDFLDAARIEGAREWYVYTLIVLPLSKAALAALAIFTFIGNWDSFLWPLLVINSESMRTLPLGLAFFRYHYGITQYHYLLAATLVCTIPPVVVFLALQRYFVRGITLTGLKN
ncbi:MAG: carbohydrate ABC transporter permease [bacterium]